MTRSGSISRLPRRSSVEQEAARWAICVERGDLSPDDIDAFEQWRRERPEHEAAFARYSQAWSDLDSLEDLADPALERALRPTLWERIGLEHEHRIAIASLAVVAALVTAFFAVHTPGPQPYAVAQEVHVTPIGDQKTIGLDDGTMMIMNTDSRVEVEYHDEMRTVRLTKGEAHFTVSRDEARPFVVYAGDSVVRALGTAFAVCLKEDGAHITVTDGEVQLAALPEAAPSVLPAVIRAREPVAANLTAGDMVVFRDEIQQFQTLSDSELNRRLAWRQGVLMFAGEPLSDVIAEVGRYTDLQILIESPELESVLFGGYFKVGNVEALFDALETSFGIDVAQEGDVVYLRRAA